MTYCMIVLRKAFLLSAVLLWTVVAPASYSYDLIIREGMPERELERIPVAAGDTLEVEYTHSMYGVPQKEVFSVSSEKDFRLERVIFGFIAAALYYDSDPSHELVSEDNVWVLRMGREHYPILKYRGSAETGHHLRVRDRGIDLSARNRERGRLIEIVLEKRSQ